MTNLQFKAYSVINEIDLNKIAVRCGIPKKYTWEEPLVLQGKLLQLILGREFTDDQKIMVFSFGSIVLVNIPESDMPTLLEYIKNFEHDIETKEWKNYADDYEIRVGMIDKLEINDTFAEVPSMI